MELRHAAIAGLAVLVLAAPAIAQLDPGAVGEQPAIGSTSSRSSQGAPGPALKASTDHPLPCGLVALPGLVRMGGMPIAQVTQMLTAQSGRLVVDRTNLTGNRDFTLRFAAEQRGQPPHGINVPPPERSSIRPSIRQKTRSRSLTLRNV